MCKARRDTPSVLHKTISRRMFCKTGMAALSAELFSSKTYAFATDGAAIPIGRFRATDAGRIRNRLAGLRPACTDAFAA